MNKNDQHETTTPEHTDKTAMTDRAPDVPRPPEVDGRTNTTQQARNKGLLIIAGILFLFVVLGGAYYENRDYFNRLFGGDSEITERPTVEDDGNTKTTKTEADIASIVSEVSPSVVSITTQTQARTYFGVAQQEGAGTGIVVSKDGYILTNKHVVDDARTVGVVLSDGTRYDDVKVVGVDPLNDVAFLKIADVDDLTPAQLGNSSTIRVGQQVVAIGNSLGQYQNTVTSGIISGTGRPVTAQSRTSVETLTDLLQTDAAINPGNSGGPLLNMAGQVIGMNTAVAADAQGIGFAIPINSIKGMLKHLLKTGEVERAFLGVNFIPVTPESAKEYDLPVQNGAYVFAERGSPVASGSPADKAGIKDKDIITKVNDVSVGTNGALTTLIGEYAPGDTVELTILRGGNERTITVTLSAYST